jgi:transposase
MVLLLEVEPTQGVTTPVVTHQDNFATLEKKSRRAAEQDRPELRAERAAWWEEFAAIDPARLVFVDESGANTAMDRTYGRAASGKRVDGPVPHGHWKVVTLTAAVRLGGVPESACLAFDGATNTACFEAYVKGCLAPTLRPGDIVIMDNLTCHKTAEVERLIRAAGAEVRYLPAYSPDLNPIEKLFSKLKAALRTAAARTVDGLIAAMGEALRAIRPGDILGWFAHSGYHAPGSTARVKEKLV